uniref:Uncharacterized protein n=1 Tax=Anopheles coluzzii TaxID=1518534 RepID=A0A8W7PZ62_ANOCL
MLFFRRRAQYLSSFISSGTNCLRDFLIIGCGFSSSSEKARVRGSKSRVDDIENAWGAENPFHSRGPPRPTGRGRYLLESAGDGGFIVSGLMQSDGEGDRSRLVVTCPRPDSDSPAQWPMLSDRCPVRLVEFPRLLFGIPSYGMPFSERNSSRSAYYSSDARVWCGEEKG